MGADDDIARGARAAYHVTRARTELNFGLEEVFT